MGSTSDTNTHIIKKGKINALKAFKSLIETRIKLNYCSQEEDFYIIKAESIPRFIKIINIADCKDYIDKIIDDNTDKDLIKLFNDYQKEKILILNNFVQCFHILTNNIEKENQFIIVDESFLNNMDIDIYQYNNREIHIDKYNRNIIFNTSHKRIRFKEIDNILCKFVESDDNNSIMYDTSKIEERDVPNFNPEGELIIKIKNNENKEQIYFTKKGDNNNEISNNENNHENENNIGNENNNGNENKDIKSNIKNSVNTINELVKDEIIDLEGVINGYINES